MRAAGRKSHCIRKEGTPYLAKDMPNHTKTNTKLNALYSFVLQKRTFAHAVSDFELIRANRLLAPVPVQFFAPKAVRPKYGRRAPSRTKMPGQCARNTCKGNNIKLFQSSQIVLVKSEHFEHRPFREHTSFQAESTSQCEWITLIVTM